MLSDVEVYKSALFVGFGPKGRQPVIEEAEGEDHIDMTSDFHRLTTTMDLDPFREYSTPTFRYRKAENRTHPGSSVIYAEDSAMLFFRKSDLKNSRSRNSDGENSRISSFLSPKNKIRQLKLLFCLW